MVHNIVFSSNGKSKVVNFNISLNEEQSSAKGQILKHPYSFIDGKAGTGKTLLACQIALDLLFKRAIERIVITRPTVGTEDNGYLPGNFQEKMEPWLVPIRDNFRKIYNKPDKLDKLESENKIELVSLSHFRGRTFDRACCIVDEYQNLSIEQMAMALGRLGKESLMIFCGDRKQIDLKNKLESATHGVSKIINSDYVYRIELLENHRHPAVDEVLDLLYNQ